MKRLIALFLSLLILTGGFAVATAETAKPYEGQEIRVLFANHMWTNSILPHLDAFTEQTGITIVKEELAEDQLSQKIAIELAARSSDLDAFMIRPLQEVKQFIKNGWLLDISDMVSDPGMESSDFIPPALEIFNQDGKYFGVPLITEREILYYRKDLLEAAGVAVPTTLEELEAAAAKLSDPDNGVYGVVSRGLTAAAVTQFSGYLRAFGGDFLDAEGNSAIASPEAIAAFTFYGDLLRNYGPPGVESMHWQQCAALYAQGKVAMYTDADALFNNVVNAEDSVVVDKTGFALLPGGKPYNVTSWGLAAGAFTEKSGAVGEFLKWAAGVEATTLTQADGVPGARTSVWANPEANVKFPADLVEAISQSGPVGVSSDRPLIISVARARDYIGQAIVVAIEGGDVAAAAAEASAGFQAVIEEDRA